MNTKETEIHKAEALLLRRKETLPDGHPKIADAMGVLGNFYHKAGRFKEALSTREETLALYKRMFPQANGHVACACAMNNLATSYLSFDRVEEALPLLKESLALFTKLLPKDHRRIAFIMSNLASLYNQLKMHDKAMSLLEQCLTLADKFPPGKHDLIGCTMNDLAGTYSCLGKHKEALNLFQQLLVHYKRILQPGDPKIDGIASCIEKIQSNEVHKLFEADDTSVKKLRIETKKEGDGETFPKAGNTVVVHYTGTLADGTKFDSSRDRGTPFEFEIGCGRVIQGWDEGVMKMSERQRAILHIPSDMAYGARGDGGAIPPNADLIFDVELISADKSTSGSWCAIL